MTTAPYSYTTYTVTTAMVATPEFSHASIELLPDALVAKATQLQVYLNGVKLTPTTDYTFISNNKIHVSATLHVDDTLTIKRNTQKGTRYVTWVDNNLITQDDLNDSSMQQFFIAQEAYDKAASSMTLDESLTYWDGNGKELRNIGPATTGTSAMTYNQLIAYVQGGSVAQINDYRVYGFDGGNQTDFALAANLNGITSRELIVAINGQIQQPADNTSGTNNSPAALNGYILVTVGGIPTVRFPDPVTTGSSVSVRVIRGAISTAPSSGSIGSSAIADGSVTVAKMSFPSGADGRTVRIDASGVASATKLGTADITDFDVNVSARTISEFGPPITALDMDGQKVTNMAAGTSATDAVTKAQLDAAIVATTGTTTYLPTASFTNNSAWLYTPANVKGFDVLIPDFYYIDGSTKVRMTRDKDNTLPQFILGSDANVSYQLKFINSAGSTKTLSVSFTRTSTSMSIQFPSGTGSTTIYFRGVYTTL